MAFAKSLNAHDATPRYAKIPRDNVIPLPLRRVLLNVTLPRASANESRVQVTALFHSSVGVYVAGMETLRDKINVHFDIAPEDLDFVMHTLIVTLPQATIGPVERRHPSQSKCADHTSTHLLPCVTPLRHNEAKTPS
jgi:hypothetical protein